MTPPRMPSQLRVERALQLIPGLEELTPVRAALFASARTPASGTERLRALGKRSIDTTLLRERLPQLLDALTRHLAVLCDSVVQAIECEERGDKAGAVRRLLLAGERERQVGRLTQARAWFELALGLAEELRARQPEIEALQELGDLCGTLLCQDEAARWYQRSLALAEAEYERDAAIRACLGLGRIALARELLSGAESWYRRGLALTGDDTLLWRGQLHQQLGIVASRRHDETVADAHLARGRALLEQTGDALALAGVCRAEAAVARARHDDAGAEAALRDALRWAERAGNTDRLVLSLGIELADVLISQGRHLEADDELRRREDDAIRGYFPRALARVYALLGRLRGIEGEEDGFIFFEIAIELCGGQSAPLVEADVLTEYGAFRRRLGQQGEARAYLDRAAELLALLGDGQRLRRIRAELEHLGGGIDAAAPSNA